MSHRRPSRLAALLIATAAFTACSVYHPQAVDIPLIQQQGENHLDIAASISTGPLPDAININATYSRGLTDHLAFQVHANCGTNNAYGQLATGLYQPIGQHFVVEGYCGIGYGSSWHSGNLRPYGDEPYDDTLSAPSTPLPYTYRLGGSYLIPFAQLNLGWRNLTPANLSIAFGMKIGRFLPNLYFQPYDEFEHSILDQRVGYTQPDILFEPQLQLRFGSHRLQHTLRAGVCVLNNMYSNSDYFYSDVITFSASLTYHF